MERQSSEVVGTLPPPLPQDALSIFQRLQDRLPKTIHGGKVWPNLPQGRQVAPRKWRPGLGHGPALLHEGLRREGILMHPGVPLRGHPGARAPPGWPDARAQATWATGGSRPALGRPVDPAPAGLGPSAKQPPRPDSLGQAPQGARKMPLESTYCCGEGCARSPSRHLHARPAGLIWHEASTMTKKSPRVPWRETVSRRGSGLLATRAADHAARLCEP